MKATNSGKYTFVIQHLLILAFSCNSQSVHLYLFSYFGAFSKTMICDCELPKKIWPESVQPFLPLYFTLKEFTSWSTPLVGIGIKLIQNVAGRFVIPAAEKVNIIAESYDSVSVSLKGNSL